MENEQQTTTIQTPPATPTPSAPAKETYDHQGRQEVDPKDFVPESDQELESQGLKPDQTETTTETTTEVKTETPTTEKEKTTTETPAKLAGKFDTVDAMKEGFRQLGGNPDLYDTPEKLAEAYLVRQSEFSRSRTDFAEQARIAAEVAKANNPTEDPTEKLLDQVDWETVTNARDLGKQLLALFPKMMPNQQPLTEEQLVEKVLPMIQEREAKQKALSTIEAEVPRLKTDQGFRRLFAFHVSGGDPKTGQPYARTEDGLRQAMKDYLQINGAITEAQVQQQKENATAKAEAAAGGESSSTEVGGEGRKDEVDEIIGAYKSRSDKLGLSI